MLTDMALERELQTYERELPNLRAHEGRYALIHGDNVVGIFDTFTDALTAGYDRFGLEPFMAQPIETEPADVLTPDFNDDRDDDDTPCRT